MVEVNAKELQKWFDRAEKIGRSNQHLSKIQLVIDQKYNHGFGYIDLSPRDYKAMVKDNQDYEQKIRCKSQERESTSDSVKLKSSSCKANKELESSHQTFSKSEKNQDSNLTHAETEALYGIISRNAPYSHSPRF